MDIGSVIFFSLAVPSSPRDGAVLGDDVGCL